MDPWSHGSAAGAAARAAAEAVAGAAAGAAAVCTYYVIIGGALRALLYLHEKVHTVAAEAAARAAAPAAALAAAPAADPWIHGSIPFIMNHIFEMKNTLECFVLNQATCGSHEHCTSSEKLSAVQFLIVLQNP